MHLDMIQGGGPAVTERRRSRRNKVHPLHLLIEGQSLRSVDWNGNGVRIRGFHRPVAAGERLRGFARDPSLTTSGHFVAEVAWCRDGEAGLRFLELGPRLSRSLDAIAED